MNATPTRPLSAQDTLTVEIATTFLSSVMAGYQAKGAGVDQRLEDHIRQAERYRDVCLTHARRLIDTHQPQDENGPVRLRATAALMGATVSGLVARGEDPGNAFGAASRMRDRFFNAANGLVERQIEAASRPEASTEMPVLNVPRDINAWRQGRMGELSLEPKAEDAARMRERLSSAANRGMLGSRAEDAKPRRPRMG